MKVYHGIEDYNIAKNPVVTTGTFDGVHLGHRKIIDRLKQLAIDNDGETVLLTFFPHPRMVLFPDDNELKLLNTQEEKIELLEKAGIDHLIIHPFTKDFSRLSSVEFVRDILVNEIGTKMLVIGYNHHFGRNREGSFENLQEYAEIYDFRVEEIPAEDVDNVEVSSTKIRKALQAGDIGMADKYLGYSYFVNGKVVEGKQLGKTIGFPTANIEVPEKYKLIPADGIYAVHVEYDSRQFKGMLNIGMNPTVNGRKRTIEVNIFDFDKTIYNENIRINFIKRLRDEVKFNNLEELKDQLVVDKKNALEVLS